MADWVCAHCGRRMMGSNETCSGSFLDTDHPANVRAIAKFKDTPGLRFRIDPLTGIRSVHADELLCGKCGEPGHGASECSASETERGDG